MILIGENIHIISKPVQEALIARDESFLKNLIDLQSDMDYIDLNVGPAKNKLEGILPWLAQLVGKNCGISFDTTNSVEMEAGLRAFDGKSIINSTSKDEPKLSKMLDLAQEMGSGLVALTMSKETGIPKTADERLELVFEIYEKALEKGFDVQNLFFDPLILPVCVDQTQALEAINTIKMIKESFEPPVKTVIGLSNISNGCVNRQLINRVFGVLAYGAGLDAAIIDAKDSELVRIFRMLETANPQVEIDNLYLDLANMIRDFGEIDDIKFNKDSSEQVNVIKTANILLNREIYTNSYTQI